MNEKLKQEALYYKILRNGYNPEKDGPIDFSLLIKTMSAGEIEIYKERLFKALNND